MKLVLTDRTSPSMIDQKQLQECQILALQNFICNDYQFIYNLKQLKSLELGSLLTQCDFSGLSFPLLFKYLPELRILKLINFDVSDLPPNNLTDLVLISNKLKTIDQLADLLLDCKDLIRLIIQQNAVCIDPRFFRSIVEMCPQLQYYNGEGVEEIEVPEQEKYEDEV